MNNQELTFDWKLLGEILRQRAQIWMGAALLVWVGLICLCLLLVPRTFTATASIALQQTPVPGGALVVLSGLGGSATKTYSGIIHSRQFALVAARKTQIQTLYHLPTEDAAAEFLQKGVTLDDKQDGLIYLTISLPAPPKLAWGQSRQVQKIRETAPLVAAAYIGLLSNYLATTNTNRDAALLREAQVQLAHARANYNRSVEQLGQVMRASPSSIFPPSAQTLPGVTIRSGDSGNAVDAMSQLSSLFAAKSRLEAEIAAGNALGQGTAALASGSTQLLSTLPGEDPLLQEARRQVTEANTQLKNLRIDLSDTNPEVISARERLQIAQARLSSESKSLREGHTTDAVRQKALQAQYVTILRQIEAAKKSNVIGRATLTEIEKRRNEMLLRLEVLKTTATQSAVLSLQREAGHNMMDIVDTPQVPKSSQPGLVLLSILCFFTALFLLQIALAIEYCLQWSRRQATSAT
jgi:uncharacterized protein involved in exopolysaccharide biosynthesis